MPGMWAYQPSRLCECWAASWRPAPVAMRMTSGTLNCPPDMCGSVAALFTIWSSASRLKLTVMISTIGRMPPSAAPMPAPTKADSESGRVADPLGAEFLEQAVADREAAAVPADVLAHEEDPIVALQRFAEGLAHRLAIGLLHWCHLAVHGAGQVGDGFQRPRFGRSDGGVELGCHVGLHLLERRRRSSKAGVASRCWKRLIGSRSCQRVDLVFVAVSSASYIEWARNR